MRSLLAGQPDAARAMLGGAAGRQLLFHGALILLGAGLYGAAVGWWRSPLQGLFNLAKFPLLILATTLGNGLLNAMVAPLLGLNLRVRDSLQLVLMSFGIAACILGAFAPVMAFAVWNLPRLEPGVVLPWAVYRSVLLLQVAVLAFAGVAANVRLFRTLEALAGNRRVARSVLFAWLAGNLFFGSQLAWICRPFIGSPTLPVEFLRPDALHGNFYEAVFRSAADLLK